jgi:hypothetical protein
MRSPVQGGRPTALVSGGMWPIGIALDATSVYWSCEGGEVMKVEKN